MLRFSMKKCFLGFTILGALCATVPAAEIKVSSPDGKAVITVTDAGGLSYAVTFDGREVVAKSRFGIIADGVDLGADVKLGTTILAQDSRVLFHVRRSFDGKQQLPRNHRVRPQRRR